MTNFGKVRVWDGTDDATVNSEGRIDVVQHAHPDSGNINFYSGSLSASEDFILVDVSDTTNYPHTDTGYVHIEGFRVDIDSDNNGDYELSLGFLDNVDATNGDYYEVYHVSGTKNTGNNKELVYSFYPNGAKCTPAFVATSTINLNDTAFQTDVNLASTLAPTTTDTPSGSGDLVLRVTRNAGTFTVNINMQYHTHS